ncbi:MAG: AraC family transcriptional regulator [Cyanobacteriota bacterium]|nr:AraC family transcriptional regulator [Cyanobacteriota bacterium]
MRAIEHQLLPNAQSVYQHLNLAGPIKRYRPHGWPIREFSGKIELSGVTLHSHFGEKASFLVEPSGRVSLVATLSGAITVQDPLGEGWAAAGDAMLLPSGSGERLYGSSAAVSSVSLFVEPAAIRRVAAVMAGQDPEDSSNGSKADHASLFPLRPLPAPDALSLFSLLRYIDSCASVDPQLPMRLGLGDVILRQVACWLQPELLAAPIGQTSPPLNGRRGSAFDELLDYIRAHLDQPLRLSDLEARSFYSRRALQYAFRDKLNTTPVQWIREQRLARAMEQLQQEGPAASIRAVALACGYRENSRFSTDFKQRFGLTPSQVKRASL